ncbi:SatD family protein [Spelaeicoccus albus]|uniref:SatD family protein n=1 Tax=Spelaeicoccus albus TaxID=1280376 RepID=A0A7Z0D2U3_9MICO|nr:SatD family protein [Spelaeicoccus albus]NYI67793.1 hypothetical protein [Spelaeicoccus albus]
MYVLTMDQKGSRRSPDLVPQLLDSANRAEPANLLVPFSRTVGDEVQGVTDDPEHAVRLTMLALRLRSWWIGVGIGDVETPLPRESREGRGPAFVNARTAIDSAKAARSGVPVAVAGSHPAGTGAFAASDAEAVLRLVGRLVSSRSDAQWRIIDALVEDGDERGSRKHVAAGLGISPQAVSKSLASAGWEDEKACRRAAAKLLEAVNSGA